MVEQSIAPSTRRSYRQAWTEFLSYVQVHNIEGHYSVDKRIMLNFVLHLINKGFSYTTISGKLAGVSFYGQLCWGRDLVGDVLLRRMLKGLNRSRSQSVHLREPITYPLLRQLLEQLPLCCYDLWEVTHFRLCIIWLFFGAFRVTELLGLRDQMGIQCSEVQVQDDTLKIWLRRSKTDQLGKGTWVQLRNSGVQECCPLSECYSFLHSSGLKGGSIFLHKNGAKISSAHLLAVLWKTQVGVGQDPGQFGTHSFRIGAATEAARLGWDIEDIKRIGRWNSACCNIYDRK